ncbi:zinc finger protein 195-like [Anthonomus grandis grandis]|uniref:zinc finger protein 195-like n=1 Tax=Anthonomus grandis grandis TaxID=2921223 RepID=UPI0021661277|nr:zinc finger protein 195-like [Anthonomus grandis grandis]
MKPKSSIKIRNDISDGDIVLKKDVINDYQSDSDDSVEITIEEHPIQETVKNYEDGKEEVTSFSIEQQFQGPIDPNKTLLLCETCPYQTTDHNYFDVHKKTHKQTYKCDLCNYITSSWAMIQKHKDIKHTKTEDLLYYCGDCEFTTMKLYHLKAHKREHKVKPPTYNCQECSYKCMSELALVNHVGTSHSVDGRCKFCLKQYRRREQKRKQTHELRHMFIRSVKQAYFKCKICRIQFPNLNDIIHHCKLLHNMTVDFDVSKFDIY